MEETKLKTAEDIRKEIFEMLSRIAELHPNKVFWSRKNLREWSMKIKKDIEALTDTRHSGGVPIIKIIKTVREVAFYQEPKTQIFYLDLNKLHKELEKVMGRAADVPTKRLCVFCNEICEDAPTERGWAEVPYNKGLHFSCARKVVDIDDVMLEDDKWIDIKDELPPQMNDEDVWTDDVLVSTLYGDRRFIEVAKYTYALDEWWYYDSDKIENVTHWQPLPDQPMNK